MLSATLGLIGALVFGAADFLGGLGAKRLRSIVVTAVAAASGAVILLALYPLLGGEWIPADVALGALSGVFGAIAIGLLYACLAIGPMSILSPLTAVVSAIAPMLWGLFVKGEQLTWLGYGGLAVALVAVVLVGFIPGEKAVRPSLRGVVMAVGSGLAIGAFLIVMDQTSAESGIVPLVLNRGVNTAITGTIALVFVFVAIRRGGTAGSALAAHGARLGATPSGRADLEHAEEHPAPAPAGVPARAWWLAVACGLVDATANVLLLLALRLGDLAVVSVLSAMYPAGTIVLAAIVLRERIAAVQWVGLGLALIAGGMFALA